MICAVALAAAGANGCGRSEIFFRENEGGATKGGGSGGANRGSAGASSSDTGGSGGSAAGTGAGSGGAGTGGTSGEGGTVVVTTLAGNGSPWGEYADGTGGPTGQAEFNKPIGIAVDAAGNVYVGDSNNNRIRKIDPQGNVTTLAGNGAAGSADGSGGAFGQAEFSSPAGVAVDAAGNVFVADSGNDSIRRVSPAGVVTTVAPITAELSSPSGVAVDGSGNLYVADTSNHRIRKIDPEGVVTTLAGNGKPGSTDGSGGASGSAELDLPTGVAVDSSGNVYVADFGTSRIRKVDPAGNVTTLAGNGKAGEVDGTGGAAGHAEFDLPSGVVVDAAGEVLVADSANDRIRLVVPGADVTSVAGDGQPGYADGPGPAAEFDYPSGVAVDGAGNVYVADTLNDRIRKISQ